MSQWFLKTIEISGGFLPGFSLSLPPGLTCVIGPRGSGKSTLVEALRLALGGTSNASKKRLGMIQANLGPDALVTVSTCSGENRTSYTIKRTFRQPATLIDSEGKAITTVDLDRGTFLPLDAYGDKEIEIIADDSFGDKRRSLLDELESGELTQIHLAVAEHRRALEANADRIRATTRLINDLTEQIEELGDVRAKLAALPPAVEGSDNQEILKAARQHQLNTEEDRFIETAIGAVHEYRSNLEELLEKMSSSVSRWTTLPPVLRESGNLKVVEGLRKKITLDLHGARETINGATASLDAIKSTLVNAQATLLTIHTEHDAHYSKLKEKDVVAGRMIQERAAAEQAVLQLDELIGQKTNATGRLQNLEQERKTLKGNYLLERERISDLRENVARKLQSAAGTNVRIRVRRNADNSAYRELLTEALRGAGVRNQGDIVEKLMRLRPEQLAQLITNNDPREFEHQMQLGDERSRRVLESLKTHLDPLELETTTIEDRIFIELNLSTNSVPNFKDATELSRGQKCTALLPLLLARRDSPLVIDQPEDNLDNHFIYETVVDTIRRMKNHRQMIFVTHNANIPVLGEADLVVVLNSDGKIGCIEKFGSLEDCREEIIDLLEGGREAFELRSQRYANR